MYIAVLEDVPDEMVPVLVAHTVLGAHLILNNTCIKYNNWLSTSFRKVVVRVTKKEFEKIRLLDNVYLGHENVTLCGQKSCAVYVVSDVDGTPNVLKFAKLWKPNVQSNS